MIDALPAIQRAMSQQPYAKRLQVTVGSDVFFLPRDVARQIEREMLLARKAQRVAAGREAA